MLQVVLLEELTFWAFYLMIIASCDDVFSPYFISGCFSGGQCGHVGRPEELLLMLKVALVIFLHVTLVTSLEGKMLIFLYLFFCFISVYVCVFGTFFTMVKLV